jgi:hypothetical protein
VARRGADQHAAEPEGCVERCSTLESTV